MAKAITALARPSQYVHMSMCSFTTGLPFYASGVFGGTFENWLYATFASRRVSMAKELRRWEKAERCPSGLNHKKNRRSLPAVDRLTPVRKERGQVPFGRAQDKQDGKRDRLKPAPTKSRKKRRTGKSACATRNH